MGPIFLTTSGRLALMLTAEGLTNEQIGVRLGISSAMLKDDIASAMRALGARTLREAVTLADQRGLFRRG